MTDEALISARYLIQTVVRAVPVNKKCYVEPIQDLVGDQQAMLLGADATTKKLAEREGMLSELNLKVQFLSDGTEGAGDLQKHPKAKIGELESVKRELESNESALKERSGGNGRLEIELSATRD